MRATLSIASPSILNGPRYVVWYDVTSYSPEWEYEGAVRRLSPLRDAWARELWHETMTTDGALVRWVYRRLSVSAQPQITLDVVEAARVLDRHGVAVPT